MDETRGNQPPDRLRHGPAARQRRPEAELRGASSVPEAMFDAGDPVVEAHLLDDNVVRRLLHRLNSVDQSRSAKQLSEAPPLDLDGRNHVSEDEIAAFFASLVEPSPHPTPRLTENLAQERRWILIDLAKNGTGLARQRATQELRAEMHAIASWEGFDLRLLEQLVAELDEATSAGAPLLFATLRLAAARAVAQLAAEAGAGS